MTAADAIVVGAGIVGAACADELARAGVRVHVVEANRPGGRATAAGMGHVLVLDDSEAQLALTRLGRELWRAREWPDDVEVDRCGTIWIAQNDDEFAAARSKCAWYAERGVSAELIDGAQLRDAEPELVDGLRGGLHIPDDLVVYPPTATASLLASAVRHGATIQTDTPVAVVGDGSVEFADGSRAEAAVVVVAAGLGTPQLLAHRPDGLRILPKKGHLLITDRAPGFVRHQLVELGYLASAHGTAKRSVAFNAQPRKTGQLLLGSSRQVDVADTRIEHDLLGAMITRATAFLPRISELTALRAWTGHRPTTADNLPYIGRLTRAPRTLVAAGHEGVGITTSLSTARLVVDLVLERAPCMDPTWFAPDRGSAEVSHRSPGRDQGLAASSLRADEAGLDRSRGRGPPGYGPTPEVCLSVDGRPLQVRAGTTVAAALLNAGLGVRTSVRDEPRAPLCGMGICFECRVRIDDRPLQRSCMIECENGMEVRTGDA